MARSQAEIDQSQRENIRDLERAEAVALGLFLMRANEVKRPAQLQKVSLATIADIWRLSALAGRRSADREAAQAKVAVSRQVVAPPPNQIARARGVSDRLAKAAKDAARGKGIKEALATIRGRIDTIARTESASVFNRAKAASVGAQVVRVWDATLDKRTCPVCASAHGTRSNPDGSFSVGEPGAVHPRCRCTFYLLSPSEV